MNTKLDKTVEAITEKNKIFEAKIKKQIKDQIEKLSKQIERIKENASKLQKGVVGLNQNFQSVTVSLNHAMSQISELQKGGGASNTVSNALTNVMNTVNNTNNNVTATNLNSNMNSAQLNTVNSNNQASASSDQ